MYSIKPIDREQILSCKTHKLLVSIEEHSKMGGLGAAVAEIISEFSGYSSLLRLGIADVFDLAGDYDGLLAQNRLTPEQIVEDILEKIS